MSWLRRLLGGGEAEAALAAGPARDTPALPEEAANPVQALLDDIGAPWRLPRAELRRRFGVITDPDYDWDLIAPRTDRPLVEGLLKPLSVQTFGVSSPHMPATSWSAIAWHGDDARENLRRTAEQLTGALGPASAEEVGNVVQCDWSFGAASLRLIVWPPELQGDGFDIEAHKTEPRLATACHIAIETGFRPALSAPERVWLDGFEPLHDLDPGRARSAADLAQAAPESELAFVREPPEDVERLLGRIGRSADGEALIACTRQLYIVPRTGIRGFTVDRITPAKGPGGSYLSVDCRLPDGGGTSIGLASGHGPDDMTGLGEALAEVFGRPLTLSPYYADC